MQSQTLNDAANECADRLLNEPEVRNYLARVLRVAFMEGCVWSKEQQLSEMKARLSAAHVTTEVTTNAN